MEKPRWSIVQSNGHYELYIDDELYSSADTWSEAYRDYLEWLKDNS